ncbi:GH25 family lysozyme [Lacticaseibacillus pabuli]|uniref:GH25 family lysozyme n=1 Tax=Lacticaseibacillus pabuli TaxID=3025672 RepID=A0ABY7WNK2_9LACO|nr:GH25 family lysozyme [Lacticaseibacillus sp. KACC 23028]WDF81797.1 GH25 family lysozyme [Lacticaseibacillus sp. KACC 23028]
MIKIEIHGVDWSKYNSTHGDWGTSKDEFAIIQIGGINGNGTYSQATYAPQVKAVLAMGRRAHTYIWFEVGNSSAKSKTVLDKFLPQVKTPKGSIIALDWEAGASAGYKSGNTAVVLAALKRIKAAGYTPVLYGYKDFMNQTLDMKQVVKLIGSSLWVAEYPDYNIRTEPMKSKSGGYLYFPSMDGIAIFQFTSTYRAGGLDGNVDLTGITWSGYKKTAPSKPVSSKPAPIKKEAPDMPVAKARPANVYGVAYVIADTKSAKGVTIKKGSDWNIYGYPDGKVDIGSDTVSASAVRIIANPLRVGAKGDAHNAKSVTLSNGKVIAPGNWHATAITADGQIDLGGKQMADAKLFTIVI